MLKNLAFECQSCKESVDLPIFTLDKQPDVACPSCKAAYRLDDEVLIRQLKKFHALCCQIYESQEILSMATIGVDVGQNKVKIPFKLLLTRLSSYLDLNIGGKPLIISFRFEPLNEMQGLE